MIVSKNISIDVEDLLKIEDLVKCGEERNFSAFIQRAVKKELSRNNL
jgi:Arc/MetJ-type ribon-helix-helix transcriptional regulator